MQLLLHDYEYSLFWREIRSEFWLASFSKLSNYYLISLVSLADNSKSDLRGSVTFKLWKLSFLYEAP